MKKVPFALVLALGLASGSAFAATQGTVTINGEIVDQTCEIAAGDINKVVTLATVPATAFTAVADVVSPQPFSIELTGCNAAADVYARFYALAADVDLANDSTLLNKAAAGATGVNIVLLDQDGTTKIPVNDSTYAVQTLSTVSPGSNILNYSAAYYSTAATVGAGDVTAVANYVIAYQ